MTIAAILLSLALAFGALAWAWSLQRETDRLIRRLDRYNKALFDAGDEIRALREELTATSAELRVAVARQTGTLQFTPEMTVREAQLVHPQVQQVLAGFHLGGCSSCAVEPDDTLGTVAAGKGVALDQLLGTLNLLVTPAEAAQAAANGGSYVGGAQRAPQAPQVVKLPNVSLEI
jgi:hypothetical protein